MDYADDESLLIVLLRLPCTEWGNGRKFPRLEPIKKLPRAIEYTVSMTESGSRRIVTTGYVLNRPRRSQSVCTTNPCHPFPSIGVSSCTPTSRIPFTAFLQVFISTILFLSGLWKLVICTLSATNFCCIPPPLTKFLCWTPSYAKRLRASGPPYHSNLKCS